MTHRTSFRRVPGGQNSNAGKKNLVRPRVTGGTWLRENPWGEQGTRFATAPETSAEASEVTQVSVSTNKSTMPCLPHETPTALSSASVAVLLSSNNARNLGGRTRQLGMLSDQTRLPD